MGARWRNAIHAGVLLALVGSAVAAPACADDEDPAAPESLPPGAAVTDAPESVSDTTAALVYGLDERPVNPTCRAPARPAPTEDVRLPLFYLNTSAGTNYQTAAAQPPGDGSRWFASYMDGTLVTFPHVNPPSTPTQVANLATLSGVPVNAGGEGGFLGFAFHPKFAQNGRVYVSWTSTEGPTGMTSRVGFITSIDGGKSFTSYSNLFSFEQPYMNHNGGGVAFGPDGYLYLSFGDGGAGGDVLGHGQDTTGYFSKILRIDVDNVPAGQTYGVPADNPFKKGGGEPATYAWGFRNPFRFSFDRSTGQLWGADVGQGEWEEVDLIQLGGNYGWSCREGAHDYFSNRCPKGPAGTIDPVYEFGHTPGNASAIIGGYVYRGKALPNLVGAYIFGDNGTGRVFSLTFDPGTGIATTKYLNPNTTAIMSSFAEDIDGEIYVIGLYGDIYKLTPAPVSATDAGPTPSAFPERLSATGCVGVADPKKPASGLIPFTVNAPLWSDGAEKERFVALPDGKRIVIGPDGDFDLPIGSVVVKTFSLGGKRVETRLLVRHDDGEWAGYTYEWRDDQSDADLLPANKLKNVSGTNWYFPGRGECVRCHNATAGRTLGLEIGQLNGDLFYEPTKRTANQLRTWEHIGLFEGGLSTPLESAPRYPSPHGQEAVDVRARAYLHANCSFCHRPGGGGRGEMDLRYERSFAETKTCNAPPITGDLGVPGTKVFVPGQPAKSQLSRRPRALDAIRMPPLASTVVDSQGAALLDAWISSVQACP